jgi:hypothetical protein
MSGSRLENSLRDLNRPGPVLCRGVVFGKYAQFGLRNGKFCTPTIQANQNVWKDPNDGLLKAFQSWKMESDLSSEFV